MHHCCQELLMAVLYNDVLLVTLLDFLLFTEYFVGMPPSIFKNTATNNMLNMNDFKFIAHAPSERLMLRCLSGV